MPILANEQKALDELKEKLTSQYNVLEMLVFGSKAKGTDVEGSNVDIMVLLGKRTQSIESEIDDLVFEINLKHGCLIVPLYFDRDELEFGPMSQSPIYKTIQREGVRM
jgi:predicted nucleotidyltransferase